MRERHPSRRKQHRRRARGRHRWIRRLDLPETVVTRVPINRPTRSWLFAPGDNPRILAKAFSVGADEVLLDLEDGVGPESKAHARGQVAEVLAERRAWVRINRPGSKLAELDLEAVGGLAKGIRLPKVESIGEITWTRDRLHGRGLPLTASIESAKGVLNASAIAASPGVTSLTFGNVDFGADIGIDPNALDAAAYARSVLVLISRAAGIEAPSDGVYVQFRDDDGLRAACASVRRFGFFGKAAIHPTQVAIINEAFSPSQAELEWAKAVTLAFESSQGTATSIDGGEMIDRPVYERALRLLRLAAETRA